MAKATIDAPKATVKLNTMNDLTSGTVVSGARYWIELFVAGDDFTNIGGTNATDNIFTASGTTPTTWTNSSLLQRIETTEIGVTDLTFGEEIEELEAFDTKSEDYLGGKTTRPVSFTYSKDVTVARLALETRLAASFKYEDEAGNDETIFGAIMLFSETFNGGYGGILNISVVGKFENAYIDTLTGA